MMSTVFPAQIDNTTTLPVVIDQVSKIDSEAINRLRAAIIAIEGNIGVNAQSTFGTIRARLDALSAAISGGGSGGFIAAGDLSGTPTHQRVIGLYGVPVSSEVPTINQFLGFDEAGWIPTTIQSSQIVLSYQVTLSGPTLVLVGTVVFNPFFNASYTTNPTTAILSDNQGTPALNVLTAPAPSTKNGFFYTVAGTPAQYVFNTYGASVLFTLTSTSGLFTATANNTLTWTQPIYFGVASTPGSYNAAFIASLGNSFLSLSRATIFTVNAGTGQYIYYAYRTGYGAATFYVDGWNGGFALAAIVSVTNSNGFTENYNIYQSDYSGEGLTTVSVF
jgi:hypothetical protein